MGSFSQIASSLILLAGDVLIGRVKITDGTDVALVGADGALSVHEIDNVVDSGNSTTSTLGVDAVFTGTGVDVLGFGAVTIQIDASHDSATDGMSFQFSTDGTNWDDVSVFTYTAADGARRFQFGTTGQFFRFVYTNGGVGQTHVRIQTILHHLLTPITSIHRLVNDTDPDRSAELTKAAIIAQAAGTGDFKAVQSTAAGNLKMSVQEFSDGVDVGNGAVGSETLRVTLANDGTGVIHPIAVSTGGCKMFNDIDLDEADIDVATGPCTVYSIYGWNSTAAPLFLKLFNTNTVTMGVTVADASIPIAANADSDGAGFVFSMPVAGLAFGTALTVAVTTGVALDDNTAPGANAANVTILYQD